MTHPMMHPGPLRTGLSGLLVGGLALLAAACGGSPTHAGGSVQACMLSGNCPQAVVQRVMNAELKFARCMRSRGVPNWPDPTIGPLGRPFFDVSAHGMTRADAHSPQMTEKINACERLTGGAPVPLG